ncbi:hypothetical protein K8I61_05030 [bacterium]|nr:hypothetical protein [bacterium]
MSTPIMAAALRVASDLRHIQVDDQHDEPRDFIQGDVVYRLLDAPYYAWLRCRMERAKKAFDTGKLPTQTWQTLRERFNGIHEWVITHIGEKVLAEAVAHLDENSYPPPRHDHAVALIDSWSERAAIMEHDGGLAQAAAEHAAAQRISRELTPEDVESFKALGVQVDVKSSVGNFTLVPDYTDQAGKSRVEISAEDLRKISMIMHTFPGTEIIYVGPQKEMPGAPWEPQVAAPPPPTLKPEPKQSLAQQAYQAPLF